MGYTTAQSIAKLHKPKDLSLFQIEVGKLSTNAQFCGKYPELKHWRLGHGSIEVLKDIACAAFSLSINANDITKLYWTQSVQ